MPLGSLLAPELKKSWFYYLVINRNFTMMKVRAIASHERLYCPYYLVIRQLRTDGTDGRVHVDGIITERMETLLPGNKLKCRVGWQPFCQCA